MPKNKLAVDDTDFSISIMDDHYSTVGRAPNAVQPVKVRAAKPAKHTVSTQAAAKAKKPAEIGWSAHDLRAFAG
jgi:hypothetical protein